MPSEGLQPLDGCDLSFDGDGILGLTRREDFLLQTGQEHLMRGSRLTRDVFHLLGFTALATRRALLPNALFHISPILALSGDVSLLVVVGPAAVLAVVNVLAFVLELTRRIPDPRRAVSLGHDLRLWF